MSHDVVHTRGRDVVRASSRDVVHASSRGSLISMSIGRYLSVWPVVVNAIVINTVTADLWPHRPWLSNINATYNLHLVFHTELHGMARILTFYIATVNASAAWKWTFRGCFGFPCMGILFGHVMFPLQSADYDIDTPGQQPIECPDPDQWPRFTEYDCPEFQSD